MLEFEAGQLGMNRKLNKQLLEVKVCNWCLVVHADMNCGLHALLSFFLFSLQFSVGLITLIRQLSNIIFDIPAKTTPLTGTLREPVDFVCSQLFQAMLLDSRLVRCRRKRSSSISAIDSSLEVCCRKTSSRKQTY